ncbi:hypothetical protein F444_23229 [Phytophthora nicotianae P1976]|uniref:Uncharacterized protein n=1 Tax=Phytophthora nicotianae P1976 TaxID=1317066 RepID=A0A080YVI4_PHYNI|nr:hypothetical protein F444_23229 [Phytophthora nicotianae P1976]
MRKARRHAVNPEMYTYLVPELPPESVRVVGGGTVFFAVDCCVKEGAEPLQLGGGEPGRHGGCVGRRKFVD